MAPSPFVLCRHDSSEIGAEPVYCCKPIKEPNALDYCPEHYAKRLQWPI